MARVFITGSSDGLGLMAGQLLSREGHEVVAHVRNESRAAVTKSALPQASAVVVGDLSTLAGMREVAKVANTTGRFDAVIHNAAVGSAEGHRVTPDNLSHVFAINVLAPYVLTALIELPERLVYMSSGMHRGGRAGLEDLQWEHRRWSGSQAYSDSKLFVAALGAAVARHRGDVCSNAVDPGWVATKMGGPSAPDDLEMGYVTQAWLAVSADPEAQVSGRFFFHKHAVQSHPSMHDECFQEALLSACAALSGLELFATGRD
jgi:NAD(P)-dependent dehydrogenase (short-subunit alcohol dehydrogenase family)